MKHILLAVVVLCACHEVAVFPDAGRAPRDAARAPGQDASQVQDAMVVVETDAQTDEAPRLTGDRSRCPAGYTDSISAGQHGGFVSSGQSRSFHLSLPEGASGPRPLVIAFHGTGLSGQQIV